RAQWTQRGRRRDPGRGQVRDRREGGELGVPRGQWTGPVGRVLGLRGGEGLMGSAPTPPKTPPRPPPPPPPPRHRRSAERGPLNTARILASTMARAKTPRVSPSGVYARPPGPPLTCTGSTNAPNFSTWRNRPSTKRATRRRPTAGVASAGTLPPPSPVSEMS